MSSGGGDDPPSSEDVAEERREATQRLLKRGGRGLALLCELQVHEEKSFNELKEDVPGSPTTLSARLEDAQEAGLIEVKQVPSDRGTTKVYCYTKTGKVLREELRRRNIDSLYQKIRTLTEELEEETEDLQDWTDNNLHSIYPPKDRDRDIHPKR